jgi:hypothetical protein
VEKEYAQQKELEKVRGRLWSQKMAEKKWRKSHKAQIKK